MARPLKELTVVCVECGYPAVTVDGKTEYRRGPKDEDEARERGWMETEFGWLCFKCAQAQRAGEEAAEAAGYNSQVGLESMADALAVQMPELHDVSVVTVVRVNPKQE